MKQILLNEALIKVCVQVVLIESNRISIRSHINQANSYIAM